MDIGLLNRSIISVDQCHKIQIVIQSIYMHVGFCPGEMMQIPLDVTS